jgi:hypothetical protein
MPTLTIVTAALNCDENISISAKSILPQIKSGKVNWLIKNSTSKFNGCLADYRNFPGIKLIAQSDSSLYQGLNQALEHIDDGYFMVLGAGDSLSTDAADFISKCLIENPNLESFYFAVQLAKTGQVLLPRPPEIMHRMACPHPGAVLSVQKARALGGFDERYQIAADYDLLCRYLVKHSASGWVDHTVVNYLGGGISETRAIEGFLEEELIRSRVFKSPQIAVCERSLHYFASVKHTLQHLKANHSPAN